MRWISTLIILFCSLSWASKDLPSDQTAPALTATAAVVQPAAEIKESEIPVVLQSEKKAAVAENPLGRGILALVIVGVLAAGGMFFMKKYRPKSVRDHAQIKILTQHYLGPKKTLTMVRVAGETLLLGVTDNNINLIKTLSLLDEEMPSEVPQQFDQAMKVLDKKQQGNEDEEFAISGIKDIVSRKLKDMRTIG